MEVKKHRLIFDYDDNAKLVAIYDNDNELIDLRDKNGIEECAQAINEWFDAHKEEVERW